MTPEERAALDVFRARVKKIASHRMDCESANILEDALRIDVLRWIVNGSASPGAVREAAAIALSTGS